VRRLGAFLDSKIIMEKLIDSIRRPEYVHLRQRRYISKYQNTEVTQLLVTSVFNTRLDNFDALVYGVPKTLLNKLKTKI